MAQYRQMKRSIGHGMELQVVAARGFGVIEAVIDILESYIKWCRESAGPWQYDGGIGSGFQDRVRGRYRVHVGPKTCSWEDSPPYPARIEAMLSVLDLARQVKAAGGDLEELRTELMRHKAKAG